MYIRTDVHVYVCTQQKHKYTHIYDKIEDTERLLIDAKAKKKTIEEDKLTGDNIYRVLMCFSKLYNAMNDEERRDLMQALIGEIHIHEEPQENGQWLKAIRFRLPVIGEDISTCLDIQNGIECVASFSKETSANPETPSAPLKTP